MTDAHVTHLVEGAGQLARRASVTLAAAPDAAITAALERMSALLREAREPVLEANRADIAALDPSFPEAMRDRLRLDDARLAAMAEQIGILAAAPFPDPVVATRELPGGLVLEERRRPVGVIGANYEARPNVTVDVASQLLKSRNAGVLRTGGAALRSATALVDHVIAPAIHDAGLDRDAVQLVRSPEREGARALVSHPGLIPLVIIRGSGPTTRDLGAHAAAHGVRTLAHADGGGVLYVHRDADRAKVRALVAGSLDRLGVCNRLNLLLVDHDVWEATLATAREVTSGMGIALSEPPHAHALGHEWALDEGREATVTVQSVGSPEEAAALANHETSGLAAAIVTEDADAARRFMADYAGTGVFWNATTRLLDGFKLLAAPETGINVDHVPGPRGPVTFRDLYLRQFVVTPAPRAV